MKHLGKQISALVDGELGHEARDRALAHVAHCGDCRERLSEERSLKDRIATAAPPLPTGRLVRSLIEIGDPAAVAPQPTAARPVRPVVPPLPARVRTWGRRPPARGDGRRPSSSRPARRRSYAAAGAVSAGLLVLGTAFAAGGSGAAPGQSVVPPAAELSVEHAATTAGLPLRDEAFDAVTATFGGLTFPAAPAAAVDR